MTGMDSELLEAPRLRPRHRSLGSHDESDYTSILVDKHGNEYDSYSLAWRYLGLYIGDCDDTAGDDDNGSQDHGRRLPSDDEGGECGERKVLWAAYVDRRYRGNGIEEYSFYDIATKEWDDAACRASGKRHRCARMDCHERHTHWKLVGVLKETEGMYDFTEQLFKHEGYCVWGDDGDDEEDAYETMETWMEKWPTSCTQLQAQDVYGNTLYIHVHPLPEGNMTLAIYDDDKCTSVSPYVDLTTYIETVYYNYYYSYDQGSQVAAAYQTAIALWNEKMAVFKTCQPCRAYNLFSENGESNSRDHRRLGSGDDNDGDGEEQERFNCYDDAGYTNVNQCYKFETKTSLEVAEPDDLRLASSQGSILRIKAYGKTYGKGGYSSPMSAGRLAANVTLGVLAAACFAAVAILFQRRLEGKKWKSLPDALRETFNTDADDAEVGKENVDDMSCSTGASTQHSGDEEWANRGTYDAREIDARTVSSTVAGKENATGENDSGTATPTAGIGSPTEEAAPSNDAALLTDLGLVLPSVKGKAELRQPVSETSGVKGPRQKASRIDEAVLLDLGLVKRSNVQAYAPPVSMPSPEPATNLATSTLLETAASTVGLDGQEATIENVSLDSETRKSAVDGIEPGIEAAEVGLVDNATSATNSLPDVFQSLATSGSSVAPSTVDDDVNWTEEVDCDTNHSVEAAEDVSLEGATNEDALSVGVDTDVGKTEEETNPSDVAAAAESAEGLVAVRAECDAEDMDTMANESNSEYFSFDASEDGSQFIASHDARDGCAEIESPLIEHSATLPSEAALADTALDECQTW